MSKALKSIMVALGAPALALCALGAAAHHSAAQFDFSQRVTVEGIVKKFNVTNPHTIAIVELTDEKRGTREVEFEGHSGSHFSRAGYTRGLAKTRAKLSILIAPRGGGKDGGPIQACPGNG